MTSLPRIEPAAAFPLESYLHLVTLTVHQTVLKTLCLWGVYLPFKCESSPGLTNTPWKRNISVCLIGLQHRHAPVVVHFIATVHRRCRQRAGVIIQLIIQIYEQVGVLNIAKIYTLNTFRTTCFWTITPIL